MSPQKREWEKTSFKAESRDGTQGAGAGIVWETASPSPPSWGSSKSSSLSPSANLDAANFTGVVTFRLLLRVTVRATTPGAWQCRREVSQLSHTIIPSGWAGPVISVRQIGERTQRFAGLVPVPIPGRRLLVATVL